MQAAVAPIEQTFLSLWPEAETFNVIDESLSRELARVGELTPGINHRIDRLVDFAEQGGAHGVLFSCSAFGRAIEAARAGRSLPVLKPNEAMLEAALTRGTRIRIVATFAPTLPSMIRELEELAYWRGVKVEAESCHVPGALDALNAGDGDTHDELIAQAVRDRPACDVVLLAQFSMARSQPVVAKHVDTPVLASPASAVEKMRRLLLTKQMAACSFSVTNRNADDAPRPQLIPYSPALF